MKVIINKKEIEIFSGAVVRDAVLAYSARSYALLNKNRLVVVDRYGNVTEPDGALTEGQVINLKRKKIK